MFAAPTVHVRSKSRFGACDDARAMVRAINAARGVPDITPVFYGGRLVGWTKGGHRSPIVTWRPARPGEHETLRCVITTYDGMINACTAGKADMSDWTKTHTTAPVANNYYDLWPCGGKPTVGPYGGAAFTAVQKSDATVGSLWTRGNVSTDVKVSRYAYAKASAGATPPTIQVYDRVLTYEACTFNANVNQAMTNGVAAQRYISAGQGGLQLMFTGQTVLGATAANLTTCTYVDQDGNAGALVPQTPVPAVIVSAAAPTATLGARVVAPSTTTATLPWGPYLPLATGDSGARSITNFTTSAANTGTMCFVMCKPLATIPLDVAGKTQLIDLVQQTPGMERIYDGACIAMMAYFPVATAATLDGGFAYVWG